jgi:energy-coupling factor transport system ATP-binding protein
VSLAFHSVSFSYEAPRRRTKTEPAWAVRDLTFTVEEGAFLAIVGHTGSGKSTIAQLMNGLLNPTTGTVTWHGRNLADKAAAAQARGSIGLVFQYPERQLFAQSLAEDLAFGPRNLGVSEAEISQRVREALNMVQLPAGEFQDRSPFDLSGGQKRRAALAGVLAMHPELLVLDEPLAGLDPQAAETMREVLRRIHEQGTTVVMISHNMDDVAELASRMLVLDQGRLVLEGAPAKVFTHETELSAMGLDVPRAWCFAQDLLRAGFPLEQEALTFEALVEAIATELKD